MDSSDSCPGLHRTDVATLMSALELAKAPSVRERMPLEARQKGSLSRGKISFKFGQKMLRKWYRMAAEQHEPLLTQ